MPNLRSTQTSIEGLTLWDLPVHGDERGWFKENWQREKMVSAGLPDFQPVQNNVSFNKAVGTTRGFHAEPWDKFVSVASGRIFGAWVDLREGPSYGRTVTYEVDPSRAVFVPRGVANAYQTLEPGTTYVYLVNGYWSPTAQYLFLNLGDKQADVQWPIPLSEAIVSGKDRGHPEFSAISPIKPKRTLVLGADGQLGKEVRRQLRGRSYVDFAARNEVDISSPDFEASRDWREYDTLVNAAAYTAVDEAETVQGRIDAWKTNVAGVSALAKVATEHGLTLVHISSDYVFDGRLERPYKEDDHFSPLGVYGQTKAAGDSIAGTVPKHYIIRTSWVIGEGKNFVKTMIGLAKKGASPSVVDDQKGRLTFTSDIASCIQHLFNSGAQYGTYNLSSTGPVVSWADIARQVFAMCGGDPGKVTATSTEEYSQGTKGPVAPRPSNSVLDLTKVLSTGFEPASWEDELRRMSEGEHPSALSAEL